MNSDVTPQPAMGRLTFGRLSEAWKGEATDFTPLLAAQLDSLGEAIGVPLESIGQIEVGTAGNRRIDIVAEDSSGSVFVIENQFGVGDHDHLTRGLAYAVAARARGLIVVAEAHRSEFREVAQYLNDVASDSDRGIAVWLVEARAVRIDGAGPWAPLFTPVESPTTFDPPAGPGSSADRIRTLDEFHQRVQADDICAAVHQVLDGWADGATRRLRFGTNHAVLEAVGPSVNGWRSVVTVYLDGNVLVPFSAYEGVNSGVGVPELVTEHARTAANELFGFNGTERHARTGPGWLSSSSNADKLGNHCELVAAAYAAALSGAMGQAGDVEAPSAVALSAESPLS